MNTIRIAVTSNGQPQAVTSETHLATVIRDAANLYQIPYDEAATMVANWHNRYQGDQVFGPGYTGPQRVQDWMQTILYPHPKAADAVVMIIVGGIAGLIWVGLIAAIIARLAGLF